MKIKASKIKNLILSKLEGISNPNALMQVLDFLRIVSLNEAKPKSNRSAILSFAGVIDDAEAQEMQETLKREFNQIEGEW